ncbi:MULTISPECIES: BREX-2 system phosphatase PglZ [Halomonadaceae]|uniref:BREX-2 system phosphatase PglZ n=1 Tax=Halomonadaceae TaxID=28256 RepID=UPI00158233ED|nr:MULTISPECIES: BREX-2 system phosphatase PglZ [Halomonas]MDI4636710.1 BREX-2 system phosphatase PglZ [Halomonas sp. BMC7]NUJ61075.1 BREX-2 system phosphatase PglZ [Halomonas taeanensis]
MPATRLTRHADTLPGAIYNQLQAILQRAPDADRVALLWRDPLQPEEQVRQIGAQTVKLVWCPSELAMREALVSHDDPEKRSLEKQGPEKLVILANLDQSQLGKDVLARLWKNEPQRISPWRTLEQLARVQTIDPRLTRHHRWMADALLNSFDRFEGHIVFGEVLDQETAWQALAWGYLDYTEAKPELPALFRWSLQESAKRRVEALPDSMRSHLGEWLQPELPRTGEVVETLLREGHAHELLAVGLACSVMYASELEAAEEMTAQVIYSGRGRFIERYLDGRKFSPSELKTFGREAMDTAQSLLRHQGLKAISVSLSQAEQILASLDFMPALGISPLLPGALMQRLDAFAANLDKALEKGGKPPLVAQAEQAWEHLQAHTLAHETQRHDQMRRAEMALRLLRWLGQASPSVTGTAPQMLSQYISDGSFVDWARTQLWAGEDHEALARVYASLSEAVAQRREQQNHGFARHLPAIARGDSLPPTLVPVESALETVVAPILAKKKPTLLLVLDGMNEAVHRELQEDLAAYGWIEVSEQADPPPRCLVSALPSATEFSRCTLLSGALVRGNSAQEKQAFAGNNKLRQQLSTRFPPVLLHKQDIQQPGSGGLAPEARARIAGTEHKLVGVVINAIDDQLSSSSQVVVHWNLQSTLPMLRQVLEAAREGGRAVVITSDHGHVLDHDSQFSQPQVETHNGERYREEGAPPGDQEAEVSGPRVLTASQRAVVPWSEKLRYTKSRNRGYHGGGSLQEVVIPLGIYISASDPAGMPGWSELPRSLPTWWHNEPQSVNVDGTVAEAPAEASAKAGRKAKKPAEPDTSMPDLFAESTPPQSAPVEEQEHHLSVEPVDTRNWIDDLFASPVFEQNFQRAGRVPVTNEQIRRLLELLDQGKGSVMEAQVAKRLEIPSIRLRGFLSAIQKILNVDGYPVLKTDRESRTVVLDKESLKLQFEL